MAIYRSCFLGIAVLGVVGCHAEDVGVHIPPTGISSVSQHDLERDLLQLLQKKDQWVPKRMRQMKWTFVSPSNCYVQEPFGNDRIDSTSSKHLYFNLNPI